jgi:hypothetical protein
MSGSMLVDDVLATAEALFLQLRSCRDLPPLIHEVLALSSTCNANPFSSTMPSATSDDNLTNGQVLPSSTTCKPAGSPQNHVTQTLHGGGHSGDLGDAGKNMSVSSDELCDTTPVDENSTSSIEILSEVA